MMLYIFAVFVLQYMMTISRQIACAQTKVDLLVVCFFFAAGNTSAWHHLFLSTTVYGDQHKHQVVFVVYNRYNQNRHEWFNWFYVFNLQHVWLSRRESLHTWYVNNKYYESRITLSISRLFRVDPVASTRMELVTDLSQLSKTPQ